MPSICRPFSITSPVKGTVRCCHDNNESSSINRNILRSKRDIYVIAQCLAADRSPPFVFLKQTGQSLRDQRSDMDPLYHISVITGFMFSQLDQLCIRILIGWHTYVKPPDRWSSDHQTDQKIAPRLLKEQNRKEQRRRGSVSVDWPSIKPAYGGTLPLWSLAGMMWFSCCRYNWITLATWSTLALVDVYPLFCQSKKTDMGSSQRGRPKSQ